MQEKQIPHRIFKENNLEQVVPFAHPDMDKWRDSLRNGLMKIIISFLQRSY